MDAEWGGLETLLAAAKFVELQEQEKNQKLIEICGKLNNYHCTVNYAPLFGLFTSIDIYNDRIVACLFIFFFNDSSLHYSSCKY